MALLRFMVRVFFRRVTVTGLDKIPTRGGGIVVSWHPNGLIDPGLILTQFPRRVVFGARHGIFKWPLLGSMMRQIGTVPIFRAKDLPNLDKAARSEANKNSLGALATEIANGSFSALFPEGISHDAPHLMELKTGAARLFYQTSSLQRGDEGSGPPAMIIPVGLHYDDKDLFRSSALVEFFEPIELPGALQPRDELDEEASRDQARSLTKEIERVLDSVCLATESWELHHLMHCARRLIRAERAKRAGANPGRTDIDERVLGFARIRTAYEALKHEMPERVEALVQRVDSYDEDLRALQLHDHELDRPPTLSFQLLTALVMQVVFVYLLLPPLLVVGYLTNGPAALLLIGIANSFKKHKKDEATIKLLVGAILFPATWVAAGVAAAYGHRLLVAHYPTMPATPAIAGIAVGLMAAVGGVVALRYLVLARETARAVRVRLTRSTRKRCIARLLAERASLHDDLVALSDKAQSEGLELPGSVLEDGRIARAPLSD
jgi:1-acyl-sn-glycerol-3-phosphate acyltransferase